MAGILFGAAGNMWSGGYTMGSYCGRVDFLAASYVDFQRLPGNTTMVAQARAPLPPPPTTVVATLHPLGGELFGRLSPALRGKLCPNSAFPAEIRRPNSPLPPIVKGPIGHKRPRTARSPAIGPSPPALVNPRNSPVAQVCRPHGLADGATSQAARSDRDSSGGNRHHCDALSGPLLVGSSAG